MASINISNRNSNNSGDYTSITTSNNFESIIGTDTVTFIAVMVVTVTIVVVVTSPARRWTVHRSRCWMRRNSQLRMPTIATEQAEG